MTIGEFLLEQWEKDLDVASVLAKPRLESLRDVIEEAWEDWELVNSEWGDPPYDRPALEKLGRVPRILKIMARPYEDRPGYRDEWEIEI